MCSSPAAAISTSEPKTKGEKLAFRLSNILARLHQGDALDKHQLAQDFEVDVRTIERDLNERLIGIVERGLEGTWQLTSSSRSTIPAKHLHRYARMSGTAHLFPDDSLRYLLAQIDQPEETRATRVQATPHEDLNDSEIFKRLHRAIDDKSICTFTYKGKAREAHPYRLIHKNGVWYLAADESERLKSFCLALIEELHVDINKRFQPNPAHHVYINDKEDVWFTKDATEVLLRVAPPAAHYFVRRPQLPKQQHRLDSDGSLLVQAQINHANQLLPVVRYWMPHVKIIKPVELHTALVHELRETLAAWQQ